MGSLPGGMILASRPPSRLQIQIGSGKAILLGCVLKGDFFPIGLDFLSCGKGGGRIGVCTSSFRGGVLDRLGISSGVLSVGPSALRCVCSRKGSGLMPIHLRKGMATKLRCCISSAVYGPSSILICTPRKVLSAVAATCARGVGLRGVSSAAQRQVSLTPLEKMGFIPDSIRTAFPMSVCARGAIRMPLRKVGFPTSGTLHTFPSGIRVAFRMKLGHFHDVGTSSFIVGISCRRLLGLNSSGCAIGLGSFPGKVGRVHVMPRRMSFLVRRMSSFSSISWN